MPSTDLHFCPRWQWKLSDGNSVQTASCDEVPGLYLSSGLRQVTPSKKPHVHALIPAAAECAGVPVGAGSAAASAVRCCWDSPPVLCAAVDCAWLVTTDREVSPRSISHHHLLLVPTKHNNNHDCFSLPCLYFAIIAVQGPPKHRHNLRGYRGYRYPHFLDWGVLYPTFQYEQVHRLNYKKAVFGCHCSGRAHDIPPDPRVG